MKYTFCTISSSDYIPFVQTLFVSIKKQNKNAKLHVLVADDKISIEKLKTGNPDLSIYSYHDVHTNEVAISITKKYIHVNTSHRWALKPVFLLHLLQNHDKVIY